MARNKYPEETVRLILEEALKLFIQKGYENTSIQDIIDNLGGLSKGAIYHHFKSKEEIFDAACKKIGDDNSIYYDKIRDDKNKNGYEKLKTMIMAAYANPNNDAVISMTTQIMSDPKFMMNQIEEMYEVVAPNYIEPIIRQGIRDGSIKTDYPKELAEVLITLLNIWINPIIVKTSVDEMKQKLDFLGVLFHGIGIDILDDEITAQYLLYFERFTYKG